MPSWWPFGSSSPIQQHPVSEFDAAVPPPPGGAFAPPPTAPKSIDGTVTSTEFKGFTPPPISSSASPPEKSKASTLFSGFKTSTKPDYSFEDFSQYTSDVRESPGFSDQHYISNTSLGLADRYLTNPRARQCWEAIKLGVKMGSSVGAIFGGLTGVYAAIVHRSALLVPVSIIGGGVSFGFFLGCGMLVRCEEIKTK